MANLPSHRFRCANRGSRKSDDIHQSGVAFAASSSDATSAGAKFLPGQAGLSPCGRLSQPDLRHGISWYTVEINGVLSRRRNTGATRTPAPPVIPGRASSREPGIQPMVRSRSTILDSGFAAARRPGMTSQSSGSTLTIEAPWLLPTQSVPGFLESSIWTRRMLVGRGN
jgi:hypothetical protein